MKQVLTLALLLGLLAGCTRKTYWQGFHGPAYLPARPAPRPSVQQLDSAAATNWAPRPALFRP